MRRQRPGRAGDPLGEARTADVVNAGMREHAQQLEVGVVGQHADVREVVQEDSRQRHHTGDRVAARAAMNIQPRAASVERQRYERPEATRVVLEVTQASEVVDNVGRGLDVPVEHRRVGRQTNGVGLLMHGEPPIGGYLVWADSPADARRKNLRPAAGQRTHSRCHQPGKHIGYTQSGALGEVVDFHGRHALN